MNEATHARFCGLSNESFCAKHVCVVSLCVASSAAWKPGCDMEHDVGVLHELRHRELVAKIGDGNVDASGAQAIGVGKFSTHPDDGGGGFARETFAQLAADESAGAGDENTLPCKRQNLLAGHCAVGRITNVRGDDVAAQGWRDFAGLRWGRTA